MAFGIHIIHTHTHTITRVSSLFARRRLKRRGAQADTLPSLPARFSRNYIFGERLRCTFSAAHTHSRIHARAESLVTLIISKVLPKNIYYFVAVTRTRAQRRRRLTPDACAVARARVHFKLARVSRVACVCCVRRACVYDITCKSIAQICAGKRSALAGDMLYLQSYTHMRRV